MKKIDAQLTALQKNKDGKTQSLSFKMTTKEALRFGLWRAINNSESSNVNQELLADLKSGLKVLEEYVDTIEFKPQEENKISFTYAPKIPEGKTAEEIDGIVKEAIGSPGMLEAIWYLIIEPIKEATPGKKKGKAKPPIGVDGGKYKRAGHLTDQILKYSYPKDQNRQISLFDILTDGTKKDIAKAGVEVTEIVEGIKLSTSETKVIDCLCKLLHERSQTAEPKKEDFYAGNVGYELVEFGGDKTTTPAPKLAFTLYELTREYKGGETVSGKDVENIKQILTELDNKRFLLSYVETTRKKDGGRIERKIEDFRKLIHILKLSETEFNKEDIEQSKTEETIVLLNPIFRRQIDSKFILYPNDINRRTIIAYGSHNLSEIALRLRDYLMRELSSKRYTPEITQDRLYWLLSEKWMKESRKTKVKQYTEKALETVKALGLLLSHEIKPGATGEPKIVFNLNKDWE